MSSNREGADASGMGVGSGEDAETGAIDNVLLMAVLGLFLKQAIVPVREPVQ